MNTNFGWKEVMGALGAALLDFRWFVIGIIVGALLVLKCAGATEIPLAASPDPKTDASSYEPDVSFPNPQFPAIIIVQHASLGCPADMRRAVQIFIDRKVVVGCAATRADGGLDIVWETGTTYNITKSFLDANAIHTEKKVLKPGYSDGPAVEPPSTVLHRSPPRNA